MHGPPRSLPRSRLAQRLLLLCGVSLLVASGLLTVACSAEDEEELTCWNCDVFHCDVSYRCCGGSGVCVTVAWGPCEDCYCELDPATAPCSELLACLGPEMVTYCAEKLDGGTDSGP